MKMFSILGAFISIAMAADEFYRVTGLANYTGDFSLLSPWYSGYLNITGESTGAESKSLHYVFIESERDPSTDPLMVWFNGGPGCSSMLAFMQENGPIRLEDGMTAPIRNTFGWTAEASVLYLESPAGVGFSTLTPDNHTVYSDMSTSQDAFMALEQWMNEVFPEYGPEGYNSPLFIAGESYGGIYAPYLTWQIYEHGAMNQSKGIPAWNIQGVLVGNGATDWDYDVSPVFPEVAYQFNIISGELLENYRAAGCEVFFNGVRNMTGGEGCSDMWDQMNEAYNGLNWYDLFRPGEGYTVAKTVEERMETKTLFGKEVTGKRGFTFSEYTPWAKKHPAMQASREGKPEILLGDVLSDYLNDETVQTQFHVNNTEKPIYWEQCSGPVQFGWHYQQEASLWIYRILAYTDIRMLFYSGDTDGAVPTLGTRNWIRDLGREVQQQWLPWQVPSVGQVAGYYEKYSGNLDFATIKGVGHMAPQWAPEAMQYLVNQWMAGIDVVTP